MRARLTRPRAAALALAAAVVLACAGCGPSASPSSSAAAGRPNIIFVLTDDLSNDLVPYMPHVLAMERAGMTFTNYAVTDSLCCPSRSSIFTGEYPHDTRVFANTGPDGGFADFLIHGDESKVYAVALQAAGYRTAMMGKYLNGYEPSLDVTDSSPYVPPGWNEWDVAGDGYNEFNYSLNEDHHVVYYGHRPADYMTNVLRARAQSFVTSSAASGDPFMLEVATFAPHQPSVPAPQFAHAFPYLQAPRSAAFDKLPTDPPKWLRGRPRLTQQQIYRINGAFRRRVEDMQSVDEMIGSLEQTVVKAGVAGNTIFVFSSDNGYHMGQYRLTPGKMTAFDTDVVVPLVVTGPGIAAGSTNPAVVQNIDLAPTFEALGGAVTPPTIDGTSLVPLLHGTVAPAGWPTKAALIEHRGPDRNPTDPDFPTKASGNPPSYEALRTAAFTYVHYRDGDHEYYNRLTDPDELHNIYSTLGPARRAHLRQGLSALIHCHGHAACAAAGEFR